MKKVVKLVSILLALMVFVVGCSADTEKKSEEKNTSKQDGSQYINLTMIKPTTINPILNNDKSVSYVLNLVYDSLFEFDENYNLQPKLVDSYNISSNNKSIDITLKDNIKWHNGQSLTASDVKYTYDLIKKNTDSSYYSLVSNISKISVNGSKNLTITFKDGYAFSLETLIFPIVSKDKLDNLKSDKLKLASNNLIGNGAYKIKTYEDRNYMLLELNKDYYDLDKNNNKKEVYVKMVPDNESQTEMVLSLDSDVSRVTLGSISKFVDNDNFVINKYQGRNYDYVLFNYDNEYLKNLDIRKAISFAVDRNSIIKDVLSLSKTDDNKEKDTTDDKDNTDEEKTEADDKATNNKENTSDKKDDKKDSKDSKKGRYFKDVTNSEVRALLKDVTFKIIVNKNNSERVKAATIISNNLEAIGIKTEIKDLEDDEMTKALDKKDYDLALIGCELPAVSDATYIIKQLGYDDKQLDKYLNALQNANSEDEIKSTYKTLQKYVKEKAIFISFGILDDYVVLNGRLDGELICNDFNVYRGINTIKIK